MRSNIIRIPANVLSHLGSAFWWMKARAGEILSISIYCFFLICGSGICVGVLVHVFQWSGDVHWPTILSLFAFGSLFALFPAFILVDILATHTEVSDWLYPLLQKLTGITFKPKPLSNRARRKPRFVIKTAANHKGIVGSCLLAVVPFLFGLYLSVVAFQMLPAPGPYTVSPLGVGVLVFGLSLFSLGTYTLVSRHKVIIDRHRRLVIWKKGILFWFWRKRQHDWDQCTAVDFGELLPYMNTPTWKNFGRRTPWMWSDWGSYSSMEPNDGSKVVLFAVDIVCGDDAIPVKEFNSAWRARRLARKIAAYMDLPIQNQSRHFA